MNWAVFFTFLAACGASAATGAMFKPGAWYRSLNKPTWTPPSWVFPVVWTTLYIAMSVAAARVAAVPGAGQALALYTLQLALNVLWTPIFFGLHRLRAGMVVIGCLWLAVAATMVAFWGLDRIAGLLMAPYLVWCTIAGALNFWVMRHNRDVPADPG